MTRFAIVSDIHSNQEAFEAVLRDIDAQGELEVVCLGDVIGYGPSPRECLALAQRFAWCLRGNHEDALLMAQQGADFNVEASRAIEWTRTQLDFQKFDREETAALWNFLGDMTKERTEGEVHYVHASPRNPTREYVRPADVHDGEKMGEIFEQIKQVCFGGHTHEAGVFTEDRRFLFPAMLNNVLHLDEKRYFVNVGSVGQPRDRDNRACYVMFDGVDIEYRRVEYDYKTTMRKISQIKELSIHLATRLKEGR